MSLRIFISLCFIASIALSNLAFAKDVILVNKRHSEKDRRSIYPYAVLNQALVRSADKYGDFEIKIAGELLPNNRTIDMLAKGDFLNVVMVVTTTEWEKRTIPIRIPLRLGALAFRLLAINKAKQAQFENVSDIEGLKRFTVGLHRNWATWGILNHFNFSISSVYQYESLFGMLAKQRFDYIPRGIHEVYDELADRKEQYPNLMVEPNIALYIPSPFYIFVSPKYPRLAERLTYGLEKMVADNSLRQMFYQHYGKAFELAQLDQRRIIRLGNPLLPKETPLHRKELWLEQIQGFDSKQASANKALQ